MSNLFKLEKLTFRNFKLFGDEFVINFNCNELIVFDGPNGHGKTTIYDAIELALTGDIRRLAIVENQQIPSDVVVAHKNRRDCFVEIVLKNSHETLQIKRSLKKDKPQGATKISNFKKLWDLSLTTDSESKIITQQELNKLIGSDNLERDFTLFHYVEQEDTAHFLKMKTEKQRAEALSVLFGDTVQMKEKVAKVKLLEKEIKDIIKDKSKEKKLLSLKNNFDSLTFNEKKYQLEYRHLLDWNNQIEWDKEIINGLTKDKRDNFFFELNKIKRLIEHKEYYLYQRKYHIAVQQEKTLNNFLGYSQYVSRYNELKGNFDKAQLITSIINDLNASKLETISENSYLPDLLDCSGQAA
ncbi:ATP-binding protein [Colwellia sp. TT2012]|uniref:ATP-binding protein n=1 Tax=Colwellia sp. TT2012 TaxID=1720342 RepID=UPI00070FA301|nr:ATP-binding protein [Colwellia sp. TT2012]